MMRTALAYMLASLAPFAWLLTRVDSAAAGRAYVADGGVYIGAAIILFGRAVVRSG